MQIGDLAIVRCPMNYANRTLQNEVVKILSIWDLGKMADVRILSGEHKGQRWQFVLSHLRRPNTASSRPAADSVKGKQESAGG